MHRPHRETIWQAGSTFLRRAIRAGRIRDATLYRARQLAHLSDASSVGNETAQATYDRLTIVR